MTAPEPPDSGPVAGSPTWAALEADGALVGLGLTPTLHIEAITGHASSRRFYRLREAGVPYPESVVLVVYPPQDTDGVDRYVRTAAWFASAGVSVPRIHAAGERALIVQDGGHRLLDAARHDSAGRRHYRQAIDAMLAVRRHGVRDRGPNPQWALDGERLRAELEFMERHTIQGWLGERRDDGTRSRHYDRLVELIDRLPRCVHHRDFHARNILVTGDRILVLDFQDAMAGPVFYDLASLLWDNYCDLPHGLVSELAHRFWLGTRDHLPLAAELPTPRRPAGLPGAARQAYCLVALQRSLKVLGTFCFQVTSGNRLYTSYVPRTWRNARAALEELEWRSFAESLACCERLSTMT